MELVPCLQNLITPEYLFDSNGMVWAAPWAESKLLTFKDDSLVRPP